MTAFRVASSSTLLLWLLAFFSAVPSGTLASTDDWKATETDTTWMFYSSALGPLIEAEKRTFMADGANNNVDMTVFQLYPESKASQRIWPLLKGMIRRMDGILQPQVAYYLQSGTEFGCRELAPNGTETAIESSHCHRHCTHSGRYCANHTDDYHGRHVVQEVARRVCLAEYLATNSSADWYSTTTAFAFPSYLQEFERRSCVARDHLAVHDCSLTAMATVGIPVNDPSLMACLEPDWHSDHHHPPLERNLDQLQQVSWNMGVSQMPQIEVNGVPILTYPDDDGNWTTGDILDEYCSAFPSCSDSPQPTFPKPLACQVCNGCNDVQTCLWTLTCDGKPAVDSREIEMEAECTPPHSTNLSTPVSPAASNPNNDVNESEDEVESQDGDVSNLSTTNEQPSKNGLLLGIIMVVAFVAGASGAFCYRRRQDFRFKDNIIEKSIDTEDSTSESTDGSFKWGKSARTNSSRSNNLAPRQSEDYLQDELDAIAFDSFMIPSGPKKSGSPPKELFQTISINDEHWV